MSSHSPRQGAFWLISIEVVELNGSKWVRRCHLAARIVLVTAALQAGENHVEAQQALDLSFGLAETATISVNGVDLTYVERGTGSPVVLVHGQLSDFRFWKSLIEEASGSYRVIAYSRRYFFPNTELPKFDGPTDVPDLIAFLEAIGAEPVHLVGHSSGGHVALNVAVQRPDLVRSLVLAEGGFVEQRTVENAGVAASRNSRAMLEAGRDEEAVRTFIDTVTGAGAFDGMSEVERQANMDNRMALGLPISPPLACDRVSSLVVPTMVVRGDSSPAFVHAVMDALIACLPAGSMTVTIPNASHAMFLDNPAAFNAAVLQFIQDHDR